MLYEFLYFSYFGELFLVAQTVKNLPSMQGTWVQTLSQEGPLKKGMATHSSILVWRIPWIEAPPYAFIESITSFLQVFL